MNKYKLMRINITTNFVLFDLYNDTTHTNFELKLCTAIKRCRNIIQLREITNGYVGKIEYLDKWVDRLELVDLLFYVER